MKMKIQNDHRNKPTPNGMFSLAERHCSFVSKSNIGGDCIRYKLTSAGRRASERQRRKDGICRRVTNWPQDRIEIYISDTVDSDSDSHFDSDTGSDLDSDSDSDCAPDPVPVLVLP